LQAWGYSLFTFNPFGVASLGLFTFNPFGVANFGGGAIFPQISPGAIHYSHTRDKST